MKAQETNKLNVPSNFGRKEKFQFKEAFNKIKPPLLTLFLILLGWEYSFRLYNVPKYVVPKPIDILMAFGRDGTLLWEHGRWTAMEAVAGALLGAFVGISIGMLFAVIKSLERGFIPLIIAANCVPIVAIAPVINIWLGAGILSKIILSAFMCFFPCCVNTVKGIHSTSPLQRDLFQSIGASRAQTFFKLQLPSSLPYMFTGLKVSATVAVIATIVAEFVGAQRGIGYLIISAAYQMDMPRLWASIVISMVLGITFFNIVGMIEKNAVPWRETIEDVS